MSRILERFRTRVVRAATNPFQHAAYPLTHSLDYPGDPGLFGPGSVSWAITGDVSSFIGGIRALLMQAAHPEVVAGVFDHSRYREDPLGRLSRTSNYVTATAFGALPEVDRAVEVVKRAHRSIAGDSHRGRSYSADTPVLAAWVHNALTDSFLTAYRYFGARPLTDAEADRYVAEQTQLGEMLFADPLPATAPALADWLANHPNAEPSPGMTEAVPFLQNPPLAPGVKLGYKAMYWAAAATVPTRIRRILGIRRYPGAILLGRAISRYLRWALGSSPSWLLALTRVDAEIPAGRFKQPLPAAVIERRGRL
ncbi:MAG: DUF2236 domain-containing protein [Acidimicrobiia bacterium]|nr:DUF2236 domain-containing protein [Acidimicrobiia bacterium]